MRNNALKNTSWILIIIVLLAFVFAFTFTMSEGIALATEPTLLSTITVGQTSDIHYFPYDRGYTPTDYGTDKQSYLDSDFYYSMTGDTKLVEESPAVVDQTMENLYLEAKQGKAPLIFIASGDLSKNGERDALLDVANRLRLVQNDIRALGTVNGVDYTNFQIVCIPGNHDLFNDEGAYYTHTNGAKVKCDGVDLTQFALIFSGLGYPNNTLAQLCNILPEEYWSTDWNPTRAAVYFNASGKGSGSTAFYGQYVQSDLATGAFDYEYYNAELQDVYTNGNTLSSSQRLAKYTSLNATLTDMKLNALSYVVHAKNGNYGLYCIDASFRSEGSCYLAFVPNGALPSSNTYYKYNDPQDALPDGEKYGFAEVSTSQAQTLVDAGKIVYILSDLDHETGGKVTEDCIYWVGQNLAARKALVPTSDGNAEPTYMLTVHQNLLEHWEQEGEILKDFTLYNYEWLVKNLLSYGIRYGFTGHMHANDVMYYTDTEGRTFFDMENGSLESYSASTHFYTVERYNDNSALAEKFSIAFKNTRTFSYDKNGNGVIDADEKDMNFNAYSWDVIYGQLLDRILTHFVADRMVDSLLGTVRNLFADDGPIASVAVIGNYHEVLGMIVDTLIDQVLHDLDYSVNGKTYNDLVKYLYGIVDDLVNWKFGDDSVGKMTLKEIVSFITSSHSAGLEITTGFMNGTSADYEFKTTDAEYIQGTPTDPVHRKKYALALRDLHNQCVDGSFVKKLLDALLNPLLLNDNGLIKQLVNHSFDLTKANFSDEQIEQVNDLIDVIKELAVQLSGKEDLEININISNFVIGDIVNPLLGVLLPIVGNLLGFNITGDDLLTILETYLDSYLSDSFYVGIGGIADKIVVAFGTDDYKDTEDPADLSKDYTIRSGSGLFKDKYTYLSSEKSAVEATQDNGRLPSIVNGHFEGTTSYTITYFTDETVYTAVELYDVDNKETPIDTVIEEIDYFKHAIAKHPDTNPGVALNSDKLWEVSKASTKLSVKTVATPAYIPLIDLGLACITHTEVFKTVGDNDEVPCDAYDRDLYYETNGVTYWNRHTVTITGLKENTTYFVKLAGTYVTSTGETKKFYLKDKLAPLNEEEFFQIRTGASSEVEEYNFIALADIQGMTESMYEKTGDVFAYIRKTFSTDGITNDYAFILNAGDVGDNGKNFAQMQWAYDKTAYLFTNTSTFVASGNHENGTYMMKRFTDYTLPTGYEQDGKTGYYYSFDYGTSHIVVLDTNDATDKGLGEKQLEWLKADLAAKNSKYTFVMMHKSMYSSGSHTNDAEIVAMRAQLVPIFAQYNVDIVFAGHDHTYATTYRIGADGKPTNDLTGVIYMTLGTCGTKFYTYKENENTTPLQDKKNSINNTLDSQTFAFIKISGDILSINGYQYVKKDSSLLDISDIGILGPGIRSSVNKEIMDKYGSTYSTIKLKFGLKAKPTDEYLIGPTGYGFKYKVGEKEYASFKDIEVKGNEKVHVDVYLINTDGGEALIDTVTLEIGNYTTLLAVSIAVPIAGALLIGGAVAAIIIIKKKKKA